MVIKLDNVSPERLYEIRNGLLIVVSTIDAMLEKFPHCGQVKKVCQETGGVYGQPCGRF